MAAAAPAGGLPPLTVLSDPDSQSFGAVNIDNVPVEIYKVEHGERKTTCWIEAVEGKEFQVSARTSWKATAVKIVLSVDGSTVRGYGLGREERADKKVVCRGARISPTQIRPFVFAKMALTDDADATTVSEDVLKHLGTVQLHFHRAELKGHAGMSKTSYRDRSQAVVDERSKKAALAHTTAYGEAKSELSSAKGPRFRSIDNKPYHTLEFKYRSRELLELEGILEPAPAPASTSPGPVIVSSFNTPAAHSSASPSTSRKKRRASSSSASHEAELQVLRAQVARLEEENSQLKDGGGRVKREAGDVEEDVKPHDVAVKGAKIGKDRVENGRTVIDLLDDD